MLLFATPMCRSLRHTTPNHPLSHLDWASSCSECCCWLFRVLGFFVSYLDFFCNTCVCYKFFATEVRLQFLFCNRDLVAEILKITLVYIFSFSATEILFRNFFATKVLLQILRGFRSRSRNTPTVCRMWCVLCGPNSAMCYPCHTIITEAADAWELSAGWTKTFS